MKRLANLKHSSFSEPSHTTASNKRNGGPVSSKNKKGSPTKNNPYPLSGHSIDTPGRRHGNGHLSFSEPAPSERRSRRSRSDPSFSECAIDQQLPAASAKS